MEALVEKMWELHDKQSKSGSPNNKPDGNGFVFAKLFPENEAKSLNVIRAALEEFQDRFQFLQTVQVQQRAERDSAIARLEQSRIFLARRLSEHHGKKYKVIEEALAFVGETSQFVSTDYPSAPYLPDEKSVTYGGISFNFFKMVVKSFDFAKRTLSIKEMGGILGNAALVALSMLALLHLHQMGSEDKYNLGPPLKQQSAFYNRIARISYRSEEPSSSDHLPHLDVTLARG